MSRIKVFYFLPNLQQGGPERQVLELINRLPQRFEPILCLYHDNIFFRRELPADQPRYVLGVEKMNLKAFSRLREIIRDENPQIVHSYRDKSNFWCRLAALAEHVPVVLSACRNRAMQLRYLLVEKALSDRCQLILTNSEGVREELTTLARVDPERIRVIYNFLDLDLFRLPTREERKDARERWDLQRGQRALLLPGRICLQKHQIGLLLALDDLARAGRLPQDTVLLLAGRRRDPRISRWVDRLAARPALRGRLRFLGAQKDMRSLYWAADILVMPSLYEGLSNAALEAGACGMPQVLSRAANADKTIEHGVTGLEVPTGHRHALATAIDALVHLDGAELRAMGRRGREHIARRFASSEDVVIEQMVAVYDELLTKVGIAADG
ncbi:MAG: glycosyltransferase [Deltaproteobacteria bacterium]|nr:glycosyltransferase [Deltaproteobacteria bacterium]